MSGHGRLSEGAGFKQLGVDDHSSRFPMQQFYTIPRFVHEYVNTSVARGASKDIGHYATQCIVTLTHVGRLSVIHVPHAVIQTKHGRSTLGLLTAGTLCLARLGYASSFRSG